MRGRPSGRSRSPARNLLFRLIAGTIMRSNVSASSLGLDSVLPETRSFRLRGVQDRIAVPHERIELVRLGPGPLDPLLLLECELAVLASSVLDRGDELAQALRALQPARVAEQGAQLTTFFVARALALRIGRALPRTRSAACAVPTTVSLEDVADVIVAEWLQQADLLAMACFVDRAIGLPAGVAGIARKRPDHHLRPDGGIPTNSSVHSSVTSKRVSSIRPICTKVQEYRAPP